MRTRVRAWLDLWDFIRVLRKEARMAKEYKLRVKANDTRLR